MSRSTTPKLGLSVYNQGDKPGAGSKTVKSGNTGLNANPLILDDAVGTEHNADGTHKSNVIDGPNLKSSTVDNTTIQLSGTPAKLSVKALGIGTSHLADDSVTAAKVADGAIDASAKIASGVITNSHMADDSVGAAELIDDAVTAPAISHDNTRTKIFLGFSIQTDADGTYAHFAGLLTTAGMAPSMPRAGSITKVTVCADNGNTATVTAAYGSKTFNAGDKITAYMDQNAADTVKIYKNGANISGLEVERSGSKWIVMVEVELDD